MSDSTTEQPTPPTALRSPDVIDRLVPTTEATMQVAMLCKLLLDITAGRHAIFTTLVTAEDQVEFDLQIAGLQETARNCLMAVARMTEILHKNSPHYPTADRLPKVKAVMQDTAPKDIRQ